MSLRIGVIDTGIMGAEHARLIAQETAGASVSAVYELDPGRAADVAAQLDAALITSMHEGGRAVTVETGDGLTDPEAR